MNNLNRVYKRYLIEAFNSPYDIKSKWVLTDMILFDTKPTNNNIKNILNNNQYIRKKISLFSCLKEIYDIIQYNNFTKIKKPSRDLSNIYIEKSRNYLNKISNYISLEEVCKNNELLNKVHKKINEVALDILLIEEPLRNSKNIKINKRLIELFKIYKNIRNKIIAEANNHV